MPTTSTRPARIACATRVSRPPSWSRRARPLRSEEPMTAADTQQLYDEYLMTNVVAGIEPVDLVSGKGARLVGRDGREYLDCFSGIAVVNTGHGHPHVLEAATRQLEALVHGSPLVYYNRVTGQLAERLA